MITQMAGEVVAAGDDWIDIRLPSVGISLRAHVTKAVAAGSKRKGPIALFTRLHVSDDGPALFGFETAREVEVFEALIGVSGVGPRLAMRILGSLAPDRLISAINGENLAILTSVSGVGARTAGRLVVELKGKLVSEEAIVVALDGAEEALEALLVLGYSRAEAMEGLSRTAAPGMAVEEQISAALRALARR